MDARPGRHGGAGDGWSPCRQRQYTAALAFAVLGCAAWYYARPENLPARVGAALAGVLLLLAIVDWNVVSETSSPRTTTPGSLRKPP